MLWMDGNYFLYCSENNCFNVSETFKSVTATCNNTLLACRDQISRHQRMNGGTLQNMFGNDLLRKPCGAWCTYKIRFYWDCQRVSSIPAVLPDRPVCHNCVSTGAVYFLDRVSWMISAEALSCVIVLTTNLLLTSAWRYSWTTCLFMQSSDPVRYFF